MNLKYNKHIPDLQLEDGRQVEFKRNIPTNMDMIIHLIVGMANTDGGIIVFGVDEKMSIKGIIGDCNIHISNIKNKIKKLSVGIEYQIKNKIIEGKNLIILKIKKSNSTSFFTRTETSPARQIAYKIKNTNHGVEILKETEMRYANVYKYMTIEAFLMSLYSGKWRFCEPSVWNDKYEQRFYCANYKLPAAKGNTPQLFATCITKEKNSEAAWKVYSHGQGLGARCVQLELNIVELRRQLRLCCKYKFEEKIIEYKPEKIILDLHKKRKSHYKEYFSSFTLDSFLKLLSIKRDAYTYEQEIRLFLIPKDYNNRNKCKKAKTIDVDIEWKKIIKKVRIDKKCSNAELASIQRACLTVGINPIIKNYKYIGEIKYPENLKDIEFELFSIDDMPGCNSITIA